MKEQILSMGVQFIIGVLGIMGSFVLKKVADAVEVQRQALAAKKEQIIIIVPLVLRRGCIMFWRKNLNLWPKPEMPRGQKWRKGCLK